MKLLNALAALVLMLVAFSAAAADYPAPKAGDWIAQDFKFHTGDVIPQLHMHYVTIGDPSGMPVVVLHGTGGSSASMLSPAFAGTLFGPGQALDAAKYYIIIPDSIGHGKSSKPSDGMKATFPKYDYDDMVVALHRLLTEGLGVRHVRLVIGFSMGGMQAWMLGEKYPGYMDALVPMASQPTAMSGRNWMLRRMLVEIIRRDPGYNNGNYTTQPPIVHIASVFFSLATAGGTLNFQKLAPTRGKADQLVDKRLAAPMKADANDFVWAWASSADYDPSPDLERIDAVVLAINSADDERNPPETGVMDSALKRVKNGKLYLIPVSDQTRGHVTTVFAKFYAKQLDELLKTAPRGAL